LIKIIFGFNPKRDVVENDRSGGRVAVVLFLRGFHPGPLKKGEEIVLRDLEKVVPVAGLAESGY
jgi:hypothetical protein